MATTTTTSPSTSESGRDRRDVAHPGALVGSGAGEVPVNARRLACYGWVSEGAGSVASANYLILGELLRRGVEVDLYAHRQHVPRPAGLAGPFRYFGFDAPALTGMFPPRVQRIANWILSPAVRPAWRRVYEPTARARHDARPYDAFLSLGTPPAFAISGVPTITWLQGPLQTELEAIRRLRPQIAATSGRRFYLALVAYYRANRLLLERGILGSSTRIVCGSEWARQALIAEGLRPADVSALPYPIDLDTFRPAGAEPDLDAPIILSLGRLDPRKRLDLLLEAFARVRSTLPGARLRIVGRQGYVPGQLSLLEGFALRDAVDYRPAVPREEVPRLLREAAVLVQPSENENFGSAVAEALACGTPVVVGPTNGTADYVDASSQVFDRYAGDSVARAVIDVVEARRRDPKGVRRSTRAAAERSFSAGGVVGRLLQTIEEAVVESRALLPVAV